MVADTIESSSPNDPLTSPSHRSIASGTTTNPNTPRPEPEPESEPDAEQQRLPEQASNQARSSPSPRRHTNTEVAPADAQASPSPKSSSSGAPSIGHIEPTWPKKIDLTKISALASSETGQRLPSLLLDIHWVPASNKAFFELRASVQLKNAPGLRRDGRTNIFIHVYPEHIRQLSFEAEPEDKMLGNDTISLSFDMSRPPALVLPPKQCEPKNKSSGNIITSMFDLARQSSWTLYAAIPTRSMSAARIRQLCAAVSEPSATSIAALKSAATLYQGQGGRIVEGDSLAPSTAGDNLPASANSEVHDDPPQYQEATSAPPYPGLDKGKKRLRRSISPPESCKQSAGDPAGIESLIHSRLSALEQHFGDALAAHRKEMVELVSQTESRIVDTLRREMGEHSAEVEESLDKRVKEEMAELEETVMRNISEAPLQATLSFPAHPWY
ncbi:hypothetical protein N8I77_013278 [Diaporthe amygdali]|uniref:Uncharacterized protein n=1 Tax=Phomopsis amygdali TaxID=1214568 RepID=A0AAD9S2F0_PHOAM|nr:hypothetical protein N8I77_013278 [Diaporthe amygdali]